MDKWNSSRSEILQLSGHIVETFGHPGADFDGIVVPPVETIPNLVNPVLSHFRQFIQGLRDREIKTAYANFCGSPTQLNGWNAVVPDFLKLSPSLVRGISRASGGWRTVQTLLQATQELGCAAIATGIDNSADVQCLVELGCPYGQGDYIGAPQPISAFISPNAALVGSSQ